LHQNSKYNEINAILESAYKLGKLISDVLTDEKPAEIMIEDKNLEIE